MTGPEKDLLTAAFREVMSGVATPVSVVTAMDDGRPHGTTVSAFSSLSMQPPMVLVALDRRSELLGLITSSLRFGINVLGGGQSALALAFARKGGAGKFMRRVLGGGRPRPAVARCIRLAGLRGRRFHRRG